jgi:hypothetical protein
MTTEIKVGSKAWVFDNNRRVYPKREPRMIYSSGPIYREHWVETEVVAETSRSWILEHWNEKVPKKGHNKRKFLFSLQEVEDDVFIHDNAYQIGQEVGRLKNVEALKQIQAIVNKCKENQP